ncbi:MAG: ATP-binding protein [Gammaproteobacteria bacterium]
MKRNLLEALIAWKHDAEHPPIILRGARQVGKTSLVREFAQQAFEQLVEVNFEQQPQTARCFTSLEPQQILNNLYLQTGQHVEIGKTLLFLDEIQECPNALKALRYFREQMPLLHVISAGSLLEFALNDSNLSMPVGRVQYFYLKPLSFREFLQATNHTHLLEYLTNATLKEQVSSIVHQQLLIKLREYFVIGGMPGIVYEYLRTGSLAKTQIAQINLLNLYRDDFGKYAPQVKHQYMRRILEQTPGLIGEHIKYSKIDPDVGSREIKIALDFLVRAGLLYRVYYSNASGLPLNAFINEKKFKLLFLDMGLCQAPSLLSPEILLQDDVMLMNKGSLAEQFVGQELLAYQPHYIEGQLMYWERHKPSSSAEVDYIINVDQEIIPVEVKAGKTGRLRSLQLFMQEHSTKVGIRISSQPLSLEKGILSIPLYMVFELPRLVRSII